MPLPELSLGRMIDWTCVSGENQAVSLLDEEFMVEFCLILKFVINCSLLGSFGMNVELSL